jgi:acyl-CoA thioesterase-1
MDRYSRRTLLLATLGALAASRAAGAEAAPVVVLFGDSIAAGYGLTPADGLAQQLRAALARLGVRAEVRNAGVPGDTSAGGRGRLASSVRKDTAVCVVEFGANDRRLGYPQALTHESLDAIVKQLKARGVSIILAGMGAGPRGEVQRQVAEANQVALYPDIMAGVGPGLRQADGAHPNAAGEKIIAAGLAPLVAQALRSR